MKKSKWNVVKRNVLKKRDSFKWKLKLNNEGNLVFTWAGMDGSISSQELTEKCAAALRDVGASDSYCQFFSDLLKCEYEINTVVHKVHQSLDNEATDISDPAALLKGIQDLTRHYNMWHHTVNSLNKKSRDVPALSVDSDRLDKSAHLKALCSIDTNQLNVKPGDDITIVDTSVPNRLKVRTSEGQEGYVPALSCILPSPDRNPSAATQRLRLELLASWTESVRKLKTLLTECLGLCSQKLAADWKAHVPTSGTSSNRERVSRRYKRLRSVVTRLPNADLNKLHHALFSLEKELSQLEDNGSATSDTKAMISKLSALDKAVLCYQMFQKQLEMFRQALESCEHPIRVVDHWEQLKPAGKQRPVRYFEVKMTLEDVETIEEVEYRKSDETTEFSSSSGAERVETDQITSTQSEEQRKFVITGVLDPRNGEEMSIMDAINAGIVDQNRGLYVNPTTGESVPIPEAMNNGQIKVEFSTATKTKEETKAVGLITIRTRMDKGDPQILEVIDATNGEHVTVAEAINRKILNWDRTTFTNSATRERLPIETAIQSGWVKVEEEDEDEADIETKMYAVSAVVDQLNKKKVPFYEAVCSGLIDKKTGNYVNNATGEQIYVAEAIKRGFLKAREIQDTKGLNIEAENKVVIERMDKMRKNVLKSVGVLNAFKKAAAVRDMKK